MSVSDKMSDLTEPDSYESHTRSIKQSSRSDCGSVSRSSSIKSMKQRKSSHDKTSNLTESDSFESHTRSTKRSPRSEQGSGSSSTSRKSMKQRKLTHELSFRPHSSDSEYLSGMPGPVLSADDMRTKLFSSFRSKGLLENVKSQLRTNLASAIKESDFSTAVKPGSSPVPNSLTSSIADFLVAEHLKQTKYDYTLSVFRTEAVSSKLQLKFSDILTFLKVDQDSQLYSKLDSLSKQLTPKSFLYNFLSVAFDSKESMKASVKTQTEELFSLSTGTIEQKMMAIEEEISNKAITELATESGTLEARLLEFQRKMEKQKKSQVAAELEAFKAKELMEMRLYEKEESRKEIEKARSDIEKNYRKMLDKLHEKENESEELTRMRQVSLDQEAFKNRQQLLADLESLREREHEMKRTHEIAMKSVTLEQAQVKALAAQLKTKEISLKAVEKRYENRLQEEILKMKLERQEEDQKHQQYLRNEETKLQVEKRTFESQKASLTKYNDGYETIKSENAQLQMSLQTAMRKISNLTLASENLNDKLRECSDYQHVKEKSLILAKELELSRLKLKELQTEKEDLCKIHSKTVNDLIDKFTKIQPDKKNANKKYDNERLEFIEKEKQLNDKCQLLEKKLHSEIIKNKELNQLFDEKILQQRAMFREIEELKALLGKVQRNNNFPRSVPTSSDNTFWRSSDVPGMTSSLQSKAPRHITQVTYNRSPKSADKSARIRYENSPNSKLGLTFVRDSKDVFEQLEKEAAELEQSYLNYQQKLRLQERTSNGKPNTNDYTALEKYTSTIHPKNSEFINEHNSKTSYSVTAKAAKFAFVDRDNIVQSSSENSLQVKEGLNSHLVESKNEHFDFIREDKAMNRNPPKAVVDTWNGDYLTEQLLASAVNEKDEGPPGNFSHHMRAGREKMRTERDFDNGDASFRQPKVELQAPPMISSFGVEKDSSDPKTFGGVSLETQLERSAVSSEYVQPMLYHSDLNQVKDEPIRFPQLQENQDNMAFKSLGQNEKTIENIEEVSDKYQDGLVESKQELRQHSVERIDDQLEYAEDKVAEIRQEEKSLLIERRELQRPEKEDSPNKSAIITDNVPKISPQSVKIIDDRLEKEELERKEREEKLLAYERERRELERLEREERGLIERSISPETNIISEGFNAELQEDAVNDPELVSKTEVVDEVKIDPLMQHYMQMIMKQKQEESSKPEVEVMNLTDDNKIESKISQKSDVSDLIEDQLDGFEEQSDEDFDW